MKTLKILLKQHTPLIHFQHDQEGATLRASEVKPKLDRFILTRLGNGNCDVGKDIAQNNGWLIGKGENYALNYKMRIEASEVQIWDMKKDSGRVDNNRRPIFETMPVFFGNMHTQDDIFFVPKKMSFSSNPISLIFSCFEEEKGLITEISKHINLFFAIHNFGTRQSKGFGCFYPQSDESRISSIIPKGYACFSLPKSEFGTWKSYYKLFDSIDLFYKTLRSGINHNNVYFKSLMYSYAIEKDSYWDKRTIRHNFRHFKDGISQDRGEKRDKQSDGMDVANKARLFRDMLGLSSIQEWRYYNDTISKEYVPIDDKDEMIDRFNSPLLIKPIFSNGGQFEIYLIPMEIPLKYINAKFIIKSKKRGASSSFIMSTPKEFDLKDFLSFISDDGIKDSVLDELEDYSYETNYRTRTIVNILKTIYGNIKYVE